MTDVPRPLSGTLAYVEGKLKSAAHPGQPVGEVQTSPFARVERLESPGSWRPVWQMRLVNDVAPTSVLLSNDASYLVTFDNWHSAGYGDNVVVIYDRQGDLVRKLSLEQILPLAWVHHIPRSVSSRWWGGQQTLVDGERLVELQVVQPGDGNVTELPHVAVRIRLVDGEVVPPSGVAWEGALAKAVALESQRLMAWEELRRRRNRPLLTPDTNDTMEWRRYVFELRDRIAGEDERMGGLVLAAPGEDPGFHDVDDISEWIDCYENDEEFSARGFVLASPTSDRLAALLVKSLVARAAGSMKTAHIVFVGTRAEGEQVSEAAGRSGAKVRVVDRSAAFPPGEVLPKLPPPLWMPAPGGS